MRPSTNNQELNTVAAQMEALVRPWQCFETVSPPLENACSTSVEAASIE